MSDKDLLGNIKKLRELTGVGFKDCKIAQMKQEYRKVIEYQKKRNSKSIKKNEQNCFRGISTC